jgi:hypothetical protein
VFVDLRRESRAREDDARGQIERKRKRAQGIISLSAPSPVHPCAVMRAASPFAVSRAVGGGVQRDVAKTIGQQTQDITSMLRKDTSGLFP